MRRIASLALLYLTTGCSMLLDLPGQENRSCTTDGHCSDGYHCQNNVCIQDQNSNDLVVTVVGDGTGSVQSLPGDINCPVGKCSAPYNHGANITLKALPGEKSTFAGWGGSCSGTGDCALSITTTTAVIASFARIKTSLIVTVQGNGTVTSSPSGLSCSSGSCTSAFGVGSTVTLTASPADGSAFVGWSGGGCVGTPACTVPLMSVTTVTAIFTPGHKVEVKMAGTGTGTVVSSPPGISCPGTCSAPFPAGSRVILTAKSGLGSYFPHWSGDCVGSYRFCNVLVDQDRIAEATFTPQTNNLVFVSSVTYPANLGGLDAYDTECNRLATAAGINNETGDAYRAWLSTSHVDARSRLGTARGFMRTDGQPFADTQDSFTATVPHQIFTPLRIDENGNDVGFATAWTGTNSSGRHYLSCGDWTSNSVADRGSIGQTIGGYQVWTEAGAPPCSTPRRIYCMTTSRSSPLTPPPVSGKLIFSSNSAVPANIGISGANARCQADRPPGVNQAKAFLATSNAPASAVLNPLANYKRPDGQVIGTGAQLAAGVLLSGIWQNGLGVYTGTQLFWTGSYYPSGAATFNCQDWTSNTAPRAIAGVTWPTDDSWWVAADTYSCSNSYYLVCVEQ